MEKVVVDKKARQGGPGRPILYVLIGSFVLLAIYMIVFVGWAGSVAPTNPSGQQTQTPGAAGSPVVPPPGGTATGGTAR